MKLKEFMANTLPRVHKKSSKRKCPAAAQSPSSSTATLTSSSARDCLNAVTCNKSLVTEDFRYLKDAATSTTSPPQSRRTPFNVNLHLQLSSNTERCGCCKPSTGAYASDDYSLSDTEYRSNSLECSDGNYNTIPKARSRIRTNPWLPSPKTSPPMSPPSTPITSPSSPINSSCTSPLHAVLTPASLTPESDSACMDSSFSASSDYSSMENYNSGVKKRKAKGQRGLGKDSSADSLSDADSLLQQSFSSDIMDQSMTTDDRYMPECGDIRGEELTINLRQGIISIHTKEVTSPVSFEYEEALESTLESPNVGRFVGSRDSLNWANRDSCHLEDVFVNMKRESVLQEEQEVTADNAAMTFEGAAGHRASSAESGDSSGTLCFDIPVDDAKSRGSSDDINEVFTRMDSDSNKENVRLQEQSSLDSGFSSTQYSEDTQDSSVSEPSSRQRTVSEIRSSLQEKVFRLRQEKHLVDEKIREAREEERQRVRNLAHFQQQVTMLRKQVLVDTLDRLKQRLADQGHRLQTCYDSVLNSQWKQAAAKRQRTSLQSLPAAAASCSAHMDTDK